MMAWAVDGPAMEPVSMSAIATPAIVCMHFRISHSPTKVRQGLGRPNAESRATVRQLIAQDTATFDP
jgi:hypothetical protein